jgi:hypothetical protein
MKIIAKCGEIVANHSGYWRQLVEARNYVENETVMCVRDILLRKLPKNK